MEHGVDIQSHYAMTTISFYPIMHLLSLKFLADHCNETFGYCHNMSYICRLSVCRL